MPKTPDATRRKILETAFMEFYRHGFQGGSLNRIVEATGQTKGALFHHFDGKQALGYAVLDDVIGPLLQQRWLNPLQGATEPIEALKTTFRRYVEEDLASGHYVLGCPLNNLAQEMSPLDAGFRERIDRLYDAWRSGIAQALQGKVRGDPRTAAALIVAAQMGIWGTAKSSQSRTLMEQAGEALCDYLDSLKPTTKEATP